MISKVVVVLGAFLAIAGASALLKSSVSLNFPLHQNTSSCEGRCNTTLIPGAFCQCNAACMQFGDCCSDYRELCLGQGEGSCRGKCDQVGTIPGAPCQCNKPCVNFGDCCPDYEAECGGSSGPITDAELEALSEELLVLENANNAAHLVQVNLGNPATQSCTTADPSPNPALRVDIRAYQVPTIASMIHLHDNYIADVSRAEVVTPQEEAEQDAFIDAIFSTPVMQRAQEFLQAKGLPNGKVNFKQIWFGLYSRSSGTLGSSGFEHVFMGEINGNSVSGFHNWVFFARQEEAGDLNYRGWLSPEFDLGAKGSILEFNMQWTNRCKPITSIWIGTSPEFELALYTVCWHARPNAKCAVKFNNQRIKIQTYDIGSGTKYVASAYPDLSN